MKIYVKPLNKDTSPIKRKMIADCFMYAFLSIFSRSSFEARFMIERKRKAAEMADFSTKNQRDNFPMLHSTVGKLLCVQPTG